MRLLRLVLVFAFALAGTQSACAGLYHPDVLGAFDLDEEGNAIPLSNEGFLLTLGNVKELGWNPRNLTVPQPPERYLELKNAIEKRRAASTASLSIPDKLSRCDGHDSLFALRHP